MPTITIKAGFTGVRAVYDVNGVLVDMGPTSVSGAVQSAQVYDLPADTSWYDITLPTPYWSPVVTSEQVTLTGASVTRSFTATELALGQDITLQSVAGVTGVLVYLDAATSGQQIGNLIPGDFITIPFSARNASLVFVPTGTGTCQLYITKKRVR